MPVRPRGRPCTFSQGIADAICDRLSEGESLFAICSDPEYPPESTVRGWALDDVQGFAAKYTLARDMGLDNRADRLIHAAETATDAALGRLRMDANRWYLSKLAPKRYGDKIAQEISGPDGGPLQISDDAARERLAQLMERIKP